MFDLCSSPPLESRDAPAGNDDRRGRAGSNTNKSPPTTNGKTIYLALCGLAFAATLIIKNVAGQDLLRNQNFRPSNTNQQQQQQQANFNQQLANIQLPPQLASLSPQQLHQLAQIREFQLQQEAEQNARRGQQSASSSQAMAAASEFDNGIQLAPAPLGLENALQPQQQQPTRQPAASASPGQIPQPAAAASSGSSSSSTAADENERHDNDGAYTESGSEMEGVTASQSDSNKDAAASTNNNSQQSSAAAPAASSPTFEVNWNKCPQLEPSESEKNKKTQVITKCLQSAPIPTNLTHENVEAHREQIATCALKVEGWFDEQGSYKFDKAEAEIRGKKLDAPIELQVLKFHVACKDEANKKFPRQQNKLIDQVQFYQACMDYYISIVCEIEVSVDQ